MAIRSYNNHHPNIDNTAYVDESSVIIGDVTIGKDSSIWPLVVIRGDVGAVKIGKGTNIQDGSILHESHTNEFASGFPLIIGDKVTVGHRATLHACTIGNLCLIGMSATVMDGAILADNIIIGAGSLVPPNKKLNANSLYMGSPVKKRRALNEKEQLFLEYSATHYIRLKASYRR